MSTPRTKPPMPREYRDHLDRVRHCIDVTVTQLTTLKALIPADDELDHPSSTRARIDHQGLARHRLNLEMAMQDMIKLARLLIDNTRASAGLDPQCCDWPTFEQTTKAEC